LVSTEGEEKKMVGLRKKRGASSGLNKAKAKASKDRKRELDGMRQ